jgi:Gluconate 2-dehydrogenase subunit 3
MTTRFPSVDTSLLPRDPATQDALQPSRQPGYYAGFSTLSQSPFWDDATRQVVEDRVEQPPKRKFFSQEAWDFWAAVFSHLIPQTDRTPDRQVPIVAVLDDRLQKNQTVGYRYEDMPHDRVVYELGIEAIDREADHRYGGKFLLLPARQQDLVLQAIQQGNPKAAPEIWKKMSVRRFWEMIMSDAIDAYYAHPWAWDEIGFGGPAYPRAYTRLERGEPEPWEVEEKRYEWLPPITAVSGEIDPSSDQDGQSQHGSGGTH